MRQTVLQVALWFCDAAGRHGENKISNSKPSQYRNHSST